MKQLEKVSENLFYVVCRVNYFVVSRGVANSVRETILYALAEGARLGLSPFTSKIPFISSRRSLLTMETKYFNPSRQDLIFYTMSAVNQTSRETSLEISSHSLSHWSSDTSLCKQKRHQRLAWTI